VTPLALYAHKALLAEIEAAKNAPTRCRYCERMTSNKRADYSLGGVALARAEHAPTCEWIEMTHGKVVAS
jgi:hypothetical protein